MFKIFRIIVFFLLISCSSKEIKNEIIYFDENRMEEISISSIFSKVETIILETHPQSLIGEISKILYSRDKIFILDKRKAQSIFIFDYNGQFIKKIEGGFTGPEQLNFPDNMILLEDRFVVYDSRQNKIMNFNLSGELEDEEYLKASNIYALDLISFDNEVLFFDFYSKPNLLFSLVSSSKDFILNQTNDFGEFKVVSGRRLPYLSTLEDNSKVQVQLPGSDCFYRFDLTGNMDRICFDFGTRKIFEPLEIVEFQDFYIKASNNEIRLLRGEYVDLEKFVLFSTQKGEKINLSGMDKNENISFEVKLVNDYNNFCPDIEYLPRYSVIPGEISLSFFPGDLKLIYSSSAKLEKLMEFFKFNNIEDTDNPILFRLRK